jgi:hypothetical protein
MTPLEPGALPSYVLCRILRSIFGEPVCKQGTWIRRRETDFKHGEKGVSGPITYDLYWDRAQRDLNVMFRFLFFSVKFSITLRLQAVMRNK